MSEIEVEAVEDLPLSLHEFVTAETLDQQGPWITEARENAGWE